VDSLLTNAGLTRDGLSSELDTGSLSAATYAALAKQGVDQATVDQYVSGMVASSAAKTAEYETAVITSVVKDAAEYQRLVTWASSTLTKAEIDSYNKLVNGGDIDTAKFAVQALHTRFAAANRPEPKLLTSAVSQGSGVAGYQSWAQVTADMRKPEYRLDSAFRAEVEARLKVSGDLPR